MDPIIPQKDYTSISPSARWLLLMKGYTDIPYAREVAELLTLPEPYIPDYNNKEASFWAKTYHFEHRYHSINSLLKEADIKNILELSSGYSFRCLEYVAAQDVHYIDTDLPEVISAKKEFVKSLQKDASENKGKLELLPLNALDRESFQKTVDLFSPGAVVIVNEGLLTYLDLQEKEKLCSIIHETLKQRGGYWITADIYLKDRQSKLGLNSSFESRDFHEKHQIDNNSFESFEKAAAFFKSMGFVVDQEAVINPAEMTAFRYLMKNLSPEQLQQIRKAGKIQATWRLKTI